MVPTYSALFCTQSFTVRNHSPTHTLIHTPVYANTGGKLCEVPCPRIQRQHVGAGIRTADLLAMRQPALPTEILSPCKVLLSPYKVLLSPHSSLPTYSSLFRHRVHVIFMKYIKPYKCPGVFISAKLWAPSRLLGPQNGKSIQALK